MEITEVRVFPSRDRRLKAYVSVTFDACFVVRGMKIIQGDDHQYFVAMPSRQKPDGSYRDIAHPITQDFRNVLEDKVLAEYHRVLQGGEGDEPGRPGDAS